MRRLVLSLLVVLWVAFGAAQTFTVTNSGPSSGLAGEELVYDITVMTGLSPGASNIEFGAFIRTSPTPNGWDTVQATSDWGVGGWQGNGDVVYTTYYLSKGVVVHIQVRVRCKSTFKGDLSVEAYARLSGGYTVRKAVITKVGPMKVKLLDVGTGQALAGSQLSPSVLRLNTTGAAAPIKRQRCKIEVEAPTLPGRYIRAYVVSNAQSGGHDHPVPTDRPHGWLLAWTSVDPGYPAVGTGAQPGTLTTSGYDLTPYRTLLDGFGKASFQYVASEISGTEQIVVVTEDVLEPQRYSVPTDVRLRVPGLVPLVANENLELYSSDVNGEKHSPGLLDGRYYVTDQTKRAIEAFAINYRADFNAKAKINDASLVDGGLFDILGDWNYSHIGHRVGMEFDLGGVTPSNATVERIAREQGWWTYPADHAVVALWGKPSVITEGSHYHFILAGVGKPYMVLTGFRTAWQDQANRILRIDLDFINKGGVDTVTNMITVAQPDNGNVTVTGGVNSDFGSMSIRQTRTASVTVNVPANVTQFILRVEGQSTTSDGPNAFPFVGDLSLGGVEGTGYYLLPITPGTPKLRSFVLAQYSAVPLNSIGAGQPIAARVSLNGPAITPTVVNLTSSDPAAAQVPATVTVPVGQAYRNFTVTTSKVSPRTVTLTANQGTVTIPITLNLLASLQSMSFSPTSVKKGLTSTLTINFTGVAAAGTMLYLNVPTNIFAGPGTYTVNVGGASQHQLVLTTKGTGTGSVTGTMNISKGSAALTVTP